MNLRQTAEVAAIAAMAAEEVIHSREPVSTESLHGYWKSSRVRLRCWFAGLRSIPNGSEGSPLLSPLQLCERVGLVRGILVAELLTRVWSSVLVARDTARSENQSGELARHVFQGQWEARQEVLRMLADENCLPADEAAAVDRLRQRVERWTDVLVGPLVREYGVTEFTFDEERAADAVRPLGSFSHRDANGAAKLLTLAGLSHAIPANRNADHPGSTLDRAVARSVLSALPRKAADAVQ